jgi:S1-C subfamily serine protease
MKDNDAEALIEKISPYKKRNHSELSNLLGNDWFDFSMFTYVGPFNSSNANWSDFHQHVMDWLNQVVLPQVIERNQQRVIRALPQSQVIDPSRIMPCLWVLESEKESKQGTAFALEDIGLVTCHHVLGKDTFAFQPGNLSIKYPINIIATNKDLDLAIIRITAKIDFQLPLGSADNIKQLDHLTIAGFPNFNYGDTGVIIPGSVVGFRVVHSVRRILTNAPIITGNSGGPVLDARNAVVGVAVTGADRMESVQDTENHGVIPIDAIKFLLS